MSVKDSVFPSAKERSNFEHLFSRWNPNYNLYANLPYLLVFDTFNLTDYFNNNGPEPFEVSKEDLDRLKKTSIDYTLCDKNDKPLICIEFDGVYKGFNVGKEYSSTQKIDTWRKLITELKLKVAHGSNFPFFVMAGTQFVVMEKNEKLAVVDCIIGSVLASQEMHKKLSKGFDPKQYSLSEEQFSLLSREEKIEFIDDWGIGVEVQSKFENNPIFNAAHVLEEELGIQKLGYGPINYPKLVGISDLNVRAKILSEADSVGASAWVELPDGTRVHADIWIPNFNVPGYNHYSFLNEVATYSALIKAKKLVEKRKHIQKRNATNRKI